MFLVKNKPISEVQDGKLALKTPRELFERSKTLKRSFSAKIEKSIIPKRDLNKFQCKYN